MRYVRLAAMKYQDRQGLFVRTMVVPTPPLPKPNVVVLADIEAIAETSV